MRFPDFISRPLFPLLYAINRRMEGINGSTIRRQVKPVDSARKQAFDRVLDEALASDPRIPIEYNLPYPKSEFLNYVCDWRVFMAHGSPLHDLPFLEPLRKSKDSNEFGNRQQIFCSPDAMWAMWFAILDKDKFDLTRNGSVRVGREGRRVKYYHFELPKINEQNRPFAEGTIYIAHAQDFPDKRSYPILDWFDGEIEEWGSTEPVKPLARIRVSPQDFPYLNKVQFSL